MNNEELLKENQELKAKLAKVEVYELQKEIEKNKISINKLKEVNNKLLEDIKTIKENNPTVFPKRGRKKKEA